jgi:hypothetical protein
MVPYRPPNIKYWVLSVFSLFYVGIHINQSFPHENELTKTTGPGLQDEAATEMLDWVPLSM